MRFIVRVDKKLHNPDYMEKFSRFIREIRRNRSHQGPSYWGWWQHGDQGKTTWDSCEIPNELGIIIKEEIEEFLKKGRYRYILEEGPKFSFPLEAGWSCH